MLFFGVLLWSYDPPRPAIHRRVVRALVGSLQSGVSHTKALGDDEVGLAALALKAANKDCLALIISGVRSLIRSGLRVPEFGP